MKSIEYIPDGLVVGWSKKLNPKWWFGNEKDTVDGPPDWTPTDKHIFFILWPWMFSAKWWRRLCWFKRNPMHNFTFYVIGAVDRPNMAYGREPETAFYDEGGRGGWNWAITLADHWLPLPFVSWNGWIKQKNYQFYIGWRPPGAAFGIKFRHAD